MTRILRIHPSHSSPLPPRTRAKLLLCRAENIFLSDGRCVVSSKYVVKHKSAKLLGKLLKVSQRAKANALKPTR